MVVIGQGEGGAAHATLTETAAASEELGAAFSVRGASLHRQLSQLVITDHLTRSYGIGESDLNPKKMVGIIAVKPTIQASYHGYDAKYPC